MATLSFRSLWLFLGIGLLLAACGPTANAPAPTTPTAVAEVPTVAPTATPKPRPTAQAVPTPEIGKPVALRDDITISPVTQTGGYFVRLKLDPSNNTIYYMNGNGDIFTLAPQETGANKTKRVYTASDIGAPSGFGAAGLAFGSDGTMFVLGNVTTPTTNQVVIQKGMLGANGERTWTNLASTEVYPASGTQFDHNGNGIVVSPDGAFVYFNIGSRTDHGEVEDANGAHPNTRELPLTSAIFRVPANAENLVLPNDADKLKGEGYLFADGVRNAYDLAFGPDNELFAIDNGPDADFADELNWIQEGKHYGFPWRFGNVDNPKLDPNYDISKDGRLQKDFFAVQSGLYVKDPSYPPPPEGVTFTDPIINVGPDADMFREADGSIYDASEIGEVAHSFTPHRSQLGLVFDNANALGGDLKGNGFMVSWGAAAGIIPDPGRDLLTFKLTKKGDTYEMTTHQLAVGFDHPVDAALLGNKLYVLDWGSRGTIWEVTLPQ